MSNQLSGAWTSAGDLPSRLSSELVTIDAILERRTAAEPSRVAVAFVDGPILTRDELRGRARTVATQLVDRGVEPGDRVVTLLPNSEEQVILLFACAYAGAVFVPLNISTGPADLEHALAETRPSVAVFATDLVDHNLLQLIQLTGAHMFTVGASSEMANKFSDLEAGNSAKSFVGSSPYDTFGLLFTGGTTGLPKAVRRSHASYIASALRYGDMLSPTRDDRHFCVSHLFHCAGQETGLIGPLFHDVPTMFAPRFSASRYISEATKFGATVGEMLGAMLIAILRQPPQQTDRDNRLRALMAAVATVPKDVQIEFCERFGVDHLLANYAMTETGTLLFNNAVDDQRAGSFGRSRGWCDVLIAGPDDVPLPDGARGEILLRPTVPFSMSDGYFGRDEATLEHRRNYWIHTGDLGRLDADGWLYFEGRQSHWIRRRGENISAVEIENVIGELSDVTECAVVASPSEMSEDDVVAVVVANDANGPLDVDAVTAHCASRLARYKVPDLVILSDVPLPRTIAKGEIERHKVADWVSAYRDTSISTGDRK